MEREHHELIRERERAQAERFAELERAFSERHAELTSRLTAARQEYSQFLSGYRALMSSFTDLSGRHVLSEEAPLPSTPLPPLAPEAAAAPLPDTAPASAAPASTPDSGNTGAPAAPRAEPDLTRHALVTPSAAITEPTTPQPSGGVKLAGAHPTGSQADSGDTTLRVEGQQFL